MSFRDSLLTVLAGGLPALIDGPDPSDGASQPGVGGGEGSPTYPQRVEEVAPSGTIQDTEPFLAPLANVTQSQVLIVTAGLIGVLALIMVVRR